MNFEDRKKYVIDRYFSLTGEKLTSDDPIVTLIIFFENETKNILKDSDFNTNIQKTLIELNEQTLKISEMNNHLDEIQLNRLQIINEISALNKNQIFKEIKDQVFKEQKKDQELLKSIYFMLILFFVIFVISIFLIALKIFLH